MDKETKPLFKVADVFDVYADAFVSDCQTGVLLFASFWGRDTSLQELLARLSLPLSDGGLASLALEPCGGPGSVVKLLVGNPDRLAKLTGRMPADNLFGNLAQLWLYDRKAVEPDHAARRALLLTAEGQSTGEAVPEAGKVWELFKTVSHLPLLDHWRQALVAEALSQGWLQTHPGARVQAVELNLGDGDYEAAIGELIRQGRLGLGEGHGSMPDAATPDAMAETCLPPSAESPKASQAGLADQADQADRTSQAGQATQTEPVRLSAQRLADGLEGFYGTQEWYRHGLVKRLLYTEGVRFFAEQGGQAGAHWFVDVVATEFLPLLRQEPFLSIKLSVADRQAAIRVDDGNGKLLREKTIEYTDMQPGDWRFYLTDDVLMLPGEY